MNTNVRLAQAIDHTKLTFDLDENETQAITQLSNEAVKYGFYAVCVHPRHVALCRELLTGSPVQIATVIGFPQEKIIRDAELQRPTVGHYSTIEKLAAMAAAIQAGANELDWVINVAAMKQDIATGSQQVLDELKAAVQRAEGRPVKVIIEIDLLTNEEIVYATRCCGKAGASMVKTSTGMVTGGKGATLEALRLIAETLLNLEANLGIKASGGIKTREQALKFLDAGACRIGTSSGIAIMQNSTSPEGILY